MQAKPVPGGSHVATLSRIHQTLQKKDPRSGAEGRLSTHDQHGFQKCDGLLERGGTVARTGEHVGDVLQDLPVAAREESARQLVSRIATQLPCCLHEHVEGGVGGVCGLGEDVQQGERPVLQDVGAQLHGAVQGHPTHHFRLRAER